MTTEERYDRSSRRHSAGADDLGLAVTDGRRFKIITNCWNKSGYSSCSVERSAFSRTAM